MVVVQNATESGNSMSATEFGCAVESVALSATELVWSSLQ